MVCPLSRPGHQGCGQTSAQCVRMFGKMKGERLAVEKEHAFSLQRLMTKGVPNSRVDVRGLASGDQTSAYVMAWNDDDDDLTAAPATFTILLKNFPAKNVRVKEYWTDKKASHAETMWKSPGLPQQVSNDQHAGMEAAGRPIQVSDGGKKPVYGGELTKTQSLPRQGVSGMEFQW